METLEEVYSALKGQGRLEWIGEKKAAAVLYFFGKGTIVGFAVTLGVGIVLSMFTALTVTRLLLNSLVGMKVTNLKLYGLNERRDA